MKYLIFVAIAIFLVLFTKELRIEIVVSDTFELSNLLDDSVKFRLE